MVSVGTPPVIVAIRPSTGAVVAAAQNNQAIEQGAHRVHRPLSRGQLAGPRPHRGRRQAGVAPEDVSDDDLEKAGRQLGVGLDYEMPGLDPETAVLTASQSNVDQVMKSKNGSSRR